MAIAFVQLDPATPFQGTSPATSGSFTGTAGNAVLVAVLNGSGNGHTTAFSGTGGTYAQETPPGNFNDPDSNTVAQGHCLSLSSGGSQTFTVTSNTAGDALFCLGLEYSGVSASAGSSIKNVAGPPTTAGGLTGTAVTVPTGSVLVAVTMDVTGSSTITAATGTQRFSGSWGSQTACVAEYAGAGASITPTFTVSAGNTFDIWQFLLTPSGGAAAPSVGVMRSRGPGPQPGRAAPARFASRPLDYTVAIPAAPVVPVLGVRRTPGPGAGGPFNNYQFRDRPRSTTVAAVPAALQAAAATSASAAASVTTAIPITSQSGSKAAVAAALTAQISFSASIASKVSASPAITTAIPLGAVSTSVVSITVAFAATNAALVAAAGTVSAATAALSSGIPLGASAATVVASTAAASTGIPFAASAASVVLTSAALSSGIPLGSTAFSRAAGTAGITTGIPLAALAGTQVSVAAQFGALSAALAATISVQPATAGGMGTGIQLGAVLRSTVSLGGQFGGAAAALQAALGASSGVSAPLSTGIALQGAAGAVPSGAALLTTRIWMGGTIFAQTSIVPALGTVITFPGTPIDPRRLIDVSDSARRIVVADSTRRQ